MTERSDLPVPADVGDAIDDTLSTLTAPGTGLSGAQRAAVVARARAAADDRSVAAEDAADPILAAARRIAADPATITGRWIEQLERRGLNRLRYVEVVGVVARIMAVDAFAWAVGRPRPGLPPVVGGTPDGATVDRARQTSAWVPIAGPPNAVTALSAVAAEREARSQLSAALYLPDDVVGRASSGEGGRRGLTRAQMEMIAARVSYANTCFY